MYPLVFNGTSIYPLAIIAIAPIPAWFLIQRLRREGVAPLQTVTAMLCMLIAAIAGAKLFSLATRGWPIGEIGMNELSGGMRFSGVLIGVAIALPLVRRYFLNSISLARAGDILALTLVIAVSFGRLACVLAGCCTGALGHGMLYWSYPPGSWVWYQHLHEGVISSSSQWSEPVLALPVLFLGASVAAALFLLRFDHYRRYNGQVFLMFLVVHELPKALLELLRIPQVPEQLAATAGVGLAGVLALMYLSSEERKPPPHTVASHMKT